MISRTPSVGSGHCSGRSLGRLRACPLNFLFRQLSPRSWPARSEVLRHRAVVRPVELELVVAVRVGRVEVVLLFERAAGEPHLHLGRAGHQDAQAVAADGVVVQDEVLQGAVLLAGPVPLPRLPGPVRQAVREDHCRLLGDAVGPQVEQRDAVVGRQAPGEVQDVVARPQRVPAQVQLLQDARPHQRRQPFEEVGGAPRRNPVPRQVQHLQRAEVWEALPQRDGRRPADVVLRQVQVGQLHPALLHHVQQLLAAGVPQIV